jgi:hydrogenase maturation factor
MCIARVGRVVAAEGERGKVEFFDGRVLDGVDLGVAGAKQGNFVEVFGNLALTVLPPSEARRRKAAWKEVRAAALLPMMSTGSS